VSRHNSPAPDAPQAPRRSAGPPATAALTAGAAECAGPGVDSDDVVDELERSLTVVGRAILRLGVPSQALHRGEHVDRSGYWVMHRLHEVGEAVRLSDLAALLELDLSTVSRQVRPLVAGGLVTRQPDPVDGRACLVSLSPRGRSVLDSVRQARREVLRDALVRWTTSDRAAIASALARLAGDLQPGHPHGAAPGDARGRPRERV
jgi:DNA-binding MarR family transcriptional regulator